MLRPEGLIVFKKDMTIDPDSRRHQFTEHNYMTAIVCRISRCVIVPPFSWSTKVMNFGEGIGHNDGKATSRQEYIIIVKTILTVSIYKW